MSDADTHTSASTAVEGMSAHRPRILAAKQALDAIILGQSEVTALLLITILAGGHGLLVGLPGLAKSLAVRSLGQVLGLGQHRIQFTPDLMPADILGADVLEQAAGGTRSFRFIEGPVFCQLLMADEINRAPPRTQSALLQAMQEHQVAVAGKNRALPRPFHVIATQNPLEQEGTYPLPEAQLDRFLLEIPIDYPDRSAEIAILAQNGDWEDQPVAPVMDAQSVLDCQMFVRNMPVPAHIADFIVDLVRLLRPDAANPASPILWGPSPRAAQALLRAAKAAAFLEGRSAPILADVIQVAGPALGHRMAMHFASGLKVADVIREAIQQLRA